jgi:hypothetical protein
MDLEHWYRCDVCGYMYTPQQVQALAHLLSSRGTDEGGVGEIPEGIPCRKKGCGGHLRPTDKISRDPRR